MRRHLNYGKQVSDNYYCRDFVGIFPNTGKTAESLNINPL